MNDILRWTRDPMLDRKLAELERGKRYMFIWTNDSRRTDRMSVLKFLGHDHQNTANHSLALDARPDAGTQQLDAKWILRVYPADADAKIRIDEKAPVPPTEPGPDTDPDAGWKVYESECSNRRPHAPHLVRQGDAQREARWRVRCPGREAPDLTSGTVGERWQAQMDDFIASARGAGNEAMRLLNKPQAMRDPIVEKQVRFRVGVAQAHATAALALAISNGIGDLEAVLSALRAEATVDELQGEEQAVGQFRDLFDPPLPGEREHGFGTI